jgi:hypothetical protein
MLTTLKGLCVFKPSACLMAFLIVIIGGCDNDETYDCPTIETIDDFPWVFELIDDLGKCGLWHLT